MKKVLFVIFLFSQLAIHNSFAPKAQFSALLVTTTRGWHHESLHYGVVALQKLAEKNEFELVLFQDPHSFKDKNLENYEVIIFLNTTGDIFDQNQQKAMERYIQSGKGFVGIHSASDTEYEWEWYTGLVGRMFSSHPPTQTARLQVLTDSFPGLEGFANGRLWTDEYYEFGPEKADNLNYILAVDETTYDTKSKGKEKLHPIAWYHNYDGGRSFYTALGHVPATFSDDAYLNHLHAGIRWAATGRR